jgi:hypothetical protein
MRNDLPNTAWHVRIEEQKSVKALKAGLMAPKIEAAEQIRVN